MDDRQFRALLNLLMCCDPWPVPDLGGGDGQHDLIRLAETESKKRGLGTWEEAYHSFKKGSLI